MNANEPGHSAFSALFRRRKAKTVLSKQNKKLSAAVLKDESQRCESFLGVSAYGG